MVGDEWRRHKQESTVSEAIHKLRVKIIDGWIILFTSLLISLLQKRFESFGIHLVSWTLSSFGSCRFDEFVPASYYVNGCKSESQNGDFKNNSF